MQFSTLQPARLINRENRFRVKIQLGERKTSAHLANPGRLEELLVPGTDIWVSEAQNPKRRTAYSLELVKINDTLISLNSQVPNTLVNNALSNHIIPGLPEYTSYRREVSLGESRIDFCVFHGAAVTWLEVKSVTLVRNGIAAFPDAPTLRGQRHLHELITVAQKGVGGMVVFVVQRSDAIAFTPNDETDPGFGRLLRQAGKTGVTIMAIKCTVTTKHIILNKTLPVLM